MILPLRVLVITAGRAAAVQLLESQEKDKHAKSELEWQEQKVRSQI